MKIYNGYQTLPEPLPASVVAVGNFDGVHRGHRAILEQLKRRSQELSVPAVVLTFTPHPLKVLVPSVAPALVNTYTQKSTLLESLDIDIVIEEPFTKSYAGYSPERFVTEVLHQSLHTLEIFVGYDFSFGRGGKATIQTLEELGAPYGLRVHCFEARSFDGIVASSTKVRHFVREGQMDTAELLLGRPFSLTGTIEHGEKRGRQLGFPTANLTTEQELLPAQGVYACWAELDECIRPAAVNIGVRPTFEDAAPTIEAHILDFSDTIYDQTMTLHFVQRIRGEQSFASLDALKKQIQTDVQFVRERLIQAPSRSVLHTRRTHT